MQHFGTVFTQTYSWRDRGPVADAIANLCDPQAVNEIGWAPEGVYSYWDPDTHEVLYIGKAVDMTKRFVEHNFLYSATDLKSEGTGKYRSLSSYLYQNSKIGFSAFIRNHHWRKAIPIWDEYAIAGWKKNNEKAKDEIAIVEGALIGAYKELHKGQLPAWNKINAKQVGKTTIEKALNYLPAISGDVSSPFVARVSLVESDKRPLCEYLEEKLNYIRQAVNEQSNDKSFNRNNLFRCMTNHLSSSSQEIALIREFFDGYVSEFMKTKINPLNKYLERLPDYSWGLI